VASSYRITAEDGTRQYLCNGKRHPSVTTVLSATESAASKASLKKWLAANPNNDAAYRGSHIHECCENYIRGLPVEPIEEYADYWYGIAEWLDHFDEFYWSERPLRPDWNNLKAPDSSSLAFVWSDEYGYAGTPDLIGMMGGVSVIADFKTSTSPYRTRFPEQGDRAGYGGFRKYQKVAQQLAAYRLAMAERTGFKCEAGLVIVSTPETSQGIFLSAEQLDLAEMKFLKRVEAFYEQSDRYEAPRRTQPPLQEQAVS
jgi:hypothetical protein